MGDLKRHREIYEAESSPEVESNDLKNRYSRHARDIVRFALLVQGTGRPVKRKELSDALEIESSQIGSYIEEADRFLMEQFCLHLFPLKSVLSNLDKTSPARDEYVLVSKADKNRSLLAKMYPDHAIQDYGIMLFVIIIIVLKDDWVNFAEIYAAFIQSGLHESDDSAAADTEEIPEAGNETETKEYLQASLGRLEALRAFKTVLENDPVSHEKVKRYRIGPYSHAIIDSKTLLILILRLQYPEDKDMLQTPEGHEKYSSVRTFLNERIQNAGFKTSL